MAVRAALCVDPVEKKLSIISYREQSVACPSYGWLQSKPASFCQNWDMSKSREMDTLADSASPRPLANAADISAARAIAFTYNDPVVFMEYAIDAAEACRAHGIKRSP